MHNSREKRPRSPEKEEPEKKKRRRITKVQEQAEIDAEKRVEILQPEPEPSIADAPKERVDVITEEPAIAVQKPEEVEKEDVVDKRRVIKVKVV